MKTRETTPTHWDNFWKVVTVPNPRLIFLNVIRSRTDLSRARTLEVGAGTGLTSSWLAEQGASSVALDYSEESVRFMTRAYGHHLPNLKIVRGDALRLPFQNSTFDLVFHDGVLEHFRNPDEFLRENWRVLRPRGLLVVGVPQKYNPYTLYKQTAILLNRWRYGWETQYSASSLVDLLRTCRFDVDEVFADGVIGSVGRRSMKVAEKVAKFLNGLSGPDMQPDRSTGVTPGEKLILFMSRIKLLHHIAFNVIAVARKPVRYQTEK